MSDLGGVEVECLSSQATMNVSLFASLWLSTPRTHGIKSQERIARNVNLSLSYPDAGCMFLRCIP